MCVCVGVGKVIEGGRWVSFFPLIVEFLLLPAETGRPGRRLEEEPVRTLTASLDCKTTCSKHTHQPTSDLLPIPIIIIHIILVLFD